MNYTGFKTILTRQFKTKFFRFLLASLGISVGVWTMTMTTSLAQGTRDTIYNAVNNIPSARQLSLSKVEGDVQIFSSSSPTLIPLSTDDMQSLQKEFSQIKSYEPTLNMTVSTPKLSSANQSCFVNPDGVSTTSISSDITNCQTIDLSYKSLDTVNAQNSGKIIGKSTNLAGNEIILCFKCNTNLNDAFGAKTPEDLLGKEIEVTYKTGPSLYKLGEKVKFDNQTDFSKFPQTQIKTDVKTTWKIAGVIDDRETTGLLNLNFTQAIDAYIPQSEFYKAFDLANPVLDVNNYGTLDYTVYADSFSNLKTLNDALKAKGGYFSISALLSFIQAINYFFMGLTVVFGIFGFIALFASVFGIINLMIVSVLERQKEIGILKSLGAKNSSIFWLFLSEAILLGVLGWIIGTITAVIMSNAIFALGNSMLKNNKDVADAFASVGVTHLTPSFPLWLLLGTLAISIFFTAISGLLPAIRAARQNPADVMRAE